MMYRFAFDLPPSTNKMYMHTRHGIKLSDEARAYKEYTAIMARNQRESDEPLDGLLSVTYRFYGSRADVDNLLKVLQDSMNKVIWKDDSQIIELHAYMYRGETDDKRVEIEVKVL